MAGLQEILILTVIVLAILILPRLLSRGKNGGREFPIVRQPRRALNGWMRLAVVSSILWPLSLALYLKPWQGDLLRYIAFGPGPVLVAWCAWWVKSGFRRYRR